MEIVVRYRQLKKKRTLRASWSHRQFVLLFPGNREQVSGS